MADIDTLMGLGISDEEKALMMANKLRGQKQAADLFSMSTIAPIAQGAQAQQQATLQAAERGGALRKAMADRQAQAERERQAQAARMAQSEAEMAARAEEGRLDRESRERIAETKSRDSSLTPASMQTALRNIGKELKPVEDVTQAINDLDSLLAPEYAKDKEDIPGLGRIEGQDTILGKVARIAAGGNAEQIHQARQRLLRNFIRESAGLAQTLSETQGVIQSYGLENLSSEETFLRAYPEIKKALKADLDRVNATYLPEVVEQFESGYAAAGKSSPLRWTPKALDEYAKENTSGNDELEALKKRRDELRAKLNGSNP